MKTNQVPVWMAGAALMAMVAVALTGCHPPSQQAAADPPADFQREGHVIIVSEKSSLRSRLCFDTARAETIQRRLSAPAVVEADPQRFARVFPPLSGRLMKLHVQLGDTVAQGQLLATLHSPDFLAAQGDWVKAKSAVQLTGRALKRQRDLLENKIAAQKDVEQAVSDYESAASQLESATGRLLAFGFNPDTDKIGRPLQVSSPLAGRVVDMASAHGEYRNDATAPLMTVADLSTVWLTASVQEKDLRYLAKGQKIDASLAAYPGETFTGAVLFIGDLIDPDVRVAKIRIAFANRDGRLKPGMFATVNFLGFPEMQITVPTTAIVQVGQTPFVFEQVRSWTFEPRQVTLGAQQGDRTVVTSGLGDGAKILAKEGVLFQ